MYKVALESRGHRVVLHTDGVACLKAYREVHEKGTQPRSSSSKKNGRDVDRPFDVVILDYRMPSMDGLKVAKEILAMNSKQRIIFASAYVVEILAESVKQLGHVVELLQKPVSIDSLIDVVEDKGLYEELERISKSFSAKEFQCYARAAGGPARRDKEAGKRNTWRLTASATGIILHQLCCSVRVC